MNNDIRGQKPIFILSSGWRTGSTMLQRLVIASGQAMIWGEAGGALDQLAEAESCYLQMLGPGGRRYKNGFGGNGAEQYRAFVNAGNSGVHNWIPCINPIEIIRDAFRKALRETYEKPARDLGYPRGGVKEVKSDLNTGRFLRQLYPEAKFVFLVRNPFDCLVSLNGTIGWTGPKTRKHCNTMPSTGLVLRRNFARRISDG